MRRAAQQTGQDPERLYKIPDIERQILYLFDYYCSVKGKDPLTYQELDSWQRVTGSVLSPGEIDLLFMIDAAFYAVQNKAK